MDGRHDWIDTLVAESKGGLASASPLFGQRDIARSARAVMRSDGLTPGLAGITLPSIT